VSTTTPFSLRIFVANGDPDGLRIVERSNWSGKALVFPRSLLPTVKTRIELGLTGVYLLLGPREDGEGEQLYIGEGDPVLPRLLDHHAKKDFWTRAVVFVAESGQLNKAHVQHLESQMVKRAKASKLLPLANANHPAEPTLSEADRAYVEVFLEHVLGILPVLGVQAFETPAQQQTKKTSAKMSCKGKGVVANGYESTQGFVVVAGSQAVLTEMPSMKQHIRGPYDIRQDLIANGVLAKKSTYYEFSQTYVFTSPSTAAAVVLGQSVNGRGKWKDDQGRTLKELQEMQLWD